jgi:hypothetical protein
MVIGLMGVANIIIMTFVYTPQNPFTAPDATASNVIILDEANEVLENANTTVGVRASGDSTKTSAASDSHPLLPFENIEALTNSSTISSSNMDFTTYDVAGNLYHITSVKGSVWDDLDLSYDVTCGGCKCFVRSVSDKKIGYLIARDIRIFDDMMKAMQLAKELEHTYGAKHFYIEPPFSASMPAETMAQLNTVAQQPLKKLGQRHDFFSLPSVIVQKMKTAKTSSLFFACFHPNCRITSANLPSFLSLVVETGDKEEFEINIAKERKILRSMLQDVPGFGADIQALVSTKGEFFYIDLDAHMYWSHRRNSLFRNGGPLKKCEEKFDAIDRVLRNTTLNAATAYS